MAFPKTPIVSAGGDGERFDESPHHPFDVLGIRWHGHPWKTDHLPDGGIVPEPTSRENRKVIARGPLESYSVGSLRRARILSISGPHLGRLTDVAGAHRSGRTREPRPDENHGTNTEISPDFRMFCRSGQAVVLHP